MRSATNEWLVALSEVLSKGVHVAPRGKPCIELRGFQTVIDMNHPVMCVKERKLGYKFMAAEAAWILSGDYRVKSIAKYAKAITQFSDDGETFYGAYGPKIRGQLRHVVDALSGDTSTRQAVINIWRENPPKTKDVPCTISLQFLVRDGVLHMIDTMRSSDLWLGWPYDVFNMAMIARYVRSCVEHKTGIKYDLGTLHLTAGSAHIYEENIDDCVKILDQWTEHGTPDLAAFDDSDRDDLISKLWEAADNDFLKAKT